MRTQTGTYRTYTDMLIALPKIGKLQVLELSHKNKWGAYYIKCQCDCGNITTTDFSSLNKSKVQSMQLKNLLPKSDLDKTIKNPETGRKIKIKSALNYDKNSKAYKAAVNSIKK
jgi:hypothetical protein